MPDLKVIYDAAIFGLVDQSALGMWAFIDPSGSLDGQSQIKLGAWL